MKEPYRKGIATHSGLESCGGTREGAAEALTEVRAGRVLSRESSSPRVPTTSHCAEGNTGGAATARRRPDPARSETPCTLGNSKRGNREILWLTWEDGSLARVGNPQGARRQ